MKICRRSLLKQARAKYLSYGSGPIEGLKTGGIIWRMKYIPRFRKFGVYVVNPLDAQKERTDLSPEEYRELTDTLLKSGWYKEYIYLVGDLEEANLDYVEVVDFLVVFLPNSRLSIGTATEVRTAWKKKIPIFLICPKQRFYNMTSSWYKRWLLLGGVRFDSFDYFLEFLGKNKRNLSREELRNKFKRLQQKQWKEERKKNLSPETFALLERAMKRSKKVKFGRNLTVK